MTMERANGSIDDGNAHHTINIAAAPRRCGAACSCTDISNFTRGCAAVDAEATRRLRTRRDAALQPVPSGRSAHLCLHVPLPALSQPRLSCRVLRRPEKETAAPPRVMLARLRSGSSYFVPRPASTTSPSEILAHAMQTMA